MRTKVSRIITVLIMTIPICSTAIIHDPEIDIMNKSSDFMYLYHNLNRSHINPENTCNTFRESYSPYEFDKNNIGDMCKKYLSEKHAFKKRDLLNSILEHIQNNSPEFKSKYGLIGIWVKITVGQYDFKNNIYPITTDFTSLNGITHGGIHTKEKTKSSNLQYHPESEQKAREIEDLIIASQKKFSDKTRTLTGFLIVKPLSAYTDDRGWQTVDVESVILSAYPINKEIKNIDIAKDRLFQVYY